MSDYLDAKWLIELKVSLLKLNQKDVLKILASLGSGYIAYRALSTYMYRRKYSHIPGPPFAGLFDFIIGINLTQIKENASKGNVLVDLLLKWKKEYGDTFKMYTIGEAVVFTANREAIKQILVTDNNGRHDKFGEIFAYPYSTRFLGQGLLTEMNWDKWKQRRAIFNHGFHRHVLMTFAGQFNQKVDILVERLIKFSNGKQVLNLFEEFNHATLDAIGFGMNIDTINHTDIAYSTSITDVLKGYQDLILDPFIHVNVTKFAKIRNVKEKIKFLRDAGRQKLMERIQIMQNSEELPNDILTNILKASENESLDVETMVDDFMTFLIGGQETTANTLAFCFLEICQNPEILAKLREEVDRELGQRTIVTYEDLGKLKYCSSVFKEALRLWGPVPELMRRIENDMEIDGYFVPKKTAVYVSTYVMARDERYFKDASQFKPERFMKDNDSIDTNIEPYTYFPFGLGPKNCIGQNFAQFEGIVVIAKLVQRFDFKLHPSQTRERAKDITMKLKGGLKCFCTLRS